MEEEDSENSSPEYARGRADGYVQGFSAGMDRGIEFCQDTLGSNQQTGTDGGDASSGTKPTVPTTTIPTIPTTATPTIAAPMTFVEIDPATGEIQAEPRVMMPTEPLETTQITQRIVDSGLDDLADQSILIESPGSQIKYDEQTKNLIIHLGSDDEE